MGKGAYISYAGKGVDIASRRADDLDKRLLVHVSQQTSPLVLELGAGAGGQAFRLVEAGARVVAIDEHPFYDVYDAYKATHQVSDSDLIFIHQTFADFFATPARQQYDDVLWQRSLHYVSYEEAKRYLQALRKIVKDQLFISVTGLESAVGEGYEGAELPLAERYCTLPEVQQATFSIEGPVCLYTKDEFTQLLLECGWQPGEVWTSAFGNHKAVCR